MQSKLVTGSSEVDAPRGHGEVLPASSTPGRPESARHLLLVDDELNVVHSLQRALRSAGMTIHTATTPARAFELLAQYPIGVVLSDQRMPEMTGSEFLKRVKTLYPATRRIVLSGYTELQSITAAINQGAISKFLTKPWNDDELLQALQSAFEDYELAVENHRLQGELSVTNRRLEVALRQQSVRLRHGESVLNAFQLAVGALPVPVIGVDAEGDLVLINTAAADLFADATPVLGEPVFPWLGLDCLAAQASSKRLEYAGRRFAVHAQAMAGGEVGRGLMVTLIPECA